MNDLVKESLRRLPAVHRIIEDGRIQEWLAEYNWSRDKTVEEIGAALNELRAAIRKEETIALSEAQVIDWILVHLRNQNRPHLVRVINGTGVILHTNLGRALISERAIDRMAEAAMYYSNLEYNIDEGKRGSRHDHVEDILCRLTGAEAAMAVNNNAAAVFLVLREMAKEKEVIVSRGQLVEIGGSFRVSEIMTESGAHLVEVGTTNKTKLMDYERAITSETALLMKVHTSNFRIMGFTETVETEQMVALGKKYNLPVYEDLGSGVLFDIRPFGIGDEATVQEIVKSGADLVSFSGDKLLGGPQAGIIVGKEKYIKRLKKNQMARVLRVDKVTLAGLEETLRAYLNPERAMLEIPVLREMLASVDTLKRRAESLMKAIQEKKILGDWQIQIEEDLSEVGGGTLPTVTIPTIAVTFKHPEKTAAWLERQLRLSKPAVVARVSKEKVIIDMRTIQEEELNILIEVLEQINDESPMD